MLRHARAPGLFSVADLFAAHESTLITFIDHRLVRIACMFHTHHLSNRLHQTLLADAAGTALAKALEQNTTLKELR
jgi:hypothetical protein